MACLDHEPPPAQEDRYPLEGTLPLGDWLAGWHSEQVRLDVSALPAGTYRLALGFYDPTSGERLEPTGGDGAGRFFLADVVK